MADLTFQSQQFAADVRSRQDARSDRRDELAQAASQHQADNLQRATEVGMQRGDQRQQFEEQRGDRNAQFQQEADLQGRAMEQRNAQFHQELALNRERFSLDKIKLDQDIKVAQTRDAVNQLQLAQEQQKWDVMKGIDEAKLREQQVQSMGLDLEAKKLTVDKLKRDLADEPRTSDYMQFLHDPQTQLATGMVVDPMTGRPRALTDEQKKDLQTQLGRAQVGRAFETVIKGASEINPKLAWQLSIIAAKAARGDLTLDEAMAEGSKLTDDHGVDVQADGSLTAKASQTAAAPTSGPLAMPGIGKISSEKVLNYAQNNIPSLRTLMDRGAGGDANTRWTSTDKSDKAVLDEFAKVVNNPTHPKHKFMMEFFLMKKLISLDEAGMSTGILSVDPTAPPPRSLTGDMMNSRSGGR